jgi:hypothetical protein
MYRHRLYWLRWRTGMSFKIQPSTPEKLQAPNPGITYQACGFPQVWMLDFESFHSPAFGLPLFATSPDWPHRMNDMPRLQVPCGSNHRITNRATANTTAFLINLRSPFGVYRAIRARPLVQPIMRGRYNRVGLLVGNVARQQAKRGLSNSCFHRHQKRAQPSMFNSLPQKAPVLV